MNSRLTLWPAVLTVVAVLALWIHGPIAQLPHYHDFADQSVFYGIPHAMDVLSNLGFAVVGVWGMIKLWPQRDHYSLKAGYLGYCLFLLSLLLTASGSAYYHLAPDNARLLWDRLPIAFATAGLMAAVRAETRPGINAGRYTMLLTGFAIAGVMWWFITEHHGAGDLRLYLLLQGLALVLIPLWQAAYSAPRADRLAFGAAMLLYVIAKLAELQDHAILSALSVVSGHTIKHVLASVAAGVIVARLFARIELA